jgi:RNA polymerase sigma-70 factor (ECF subfamily)
MQMKDYYLEYKGLLFKLAYQLTGSVSDAEDAVQDVFLKIYDVPAEKLASPKAYLCKMVANRCRDLLKSARRKRESYYGEWLPEPYLTPEEDAMDAVIRDDLLSYGMIVLLEKLTPAERAVFVLREALGFDYDEIAELVDKSEVNCRKLISRAKKKMGISAEQPVHAEPSAEEWVQGFMKALRQGDANELLTMLSQDVVLVSDGGGKATASLEPIATREPVAAFLLGPVRRASMVDDIPMIQVARLNGQPGIVIRSGEGIHTVIMLNREGESVRNLYIVRNPDKLMHVD